MAGAANSVPRGRGARPAYRLLGRVGLNGTHISTRDWQCIKATRLKIIANALVEDVTAPPGSAMPSDRLVVAPVCAMLCVYRRFRRDVEVAGITCVR